MAASFGTDVSCTTQLLAGRIVSGLELVAESVYRRLTTQRGRLREDPDYGLDVRQFLGRGLTDAELLAIAGEVRGEILKDRDRIEDARVVATRVDTGTGVELHLAIDVITSAGPFDLTLKVTQVTVQILKLGGVA